jgi:hypothetical protein
MKKIIIYIIKAFGLMVMLLSSYSFLKNIGTISVSEPVYAIGFIIGALIPIAIGYFLFRLKVENILMNRFFQNHAKETIQVYLFWVNFVEGITTTDEFKKRLKKIKSTKVYKDELNRFYLTQAEASAQNIDAEELSIKELLESTTYLSFLIERLGAITLYNNEDLKHITKDSQVVWVFFKDIFTPMVLRGEQFIYPYDIENDRYRFGYTVVYDENALMGVYDIENDKLVLPIKYKYIESLGNIVEVSDNGIDFDIYDLTEENAIAQKKTISTHDKPSLSNISQEIKQKIDLSKIELQDYLKLFDTPKTQSDLIRIGLWGAKVGVIKVPNGFDEIIEDSSIGTIIWQYPVSADMYDMSMELPVEFVKKDASTVTLGIAPKYLILEPEYRQRLAYEK